MGRGVLIEHKHENQLLRVYRRRWPFSIGNDRRSDIFLALPKTFRAEVRRSGNSWEWKDEEGIKKSKDGLFQIGAHSFSVKSLPEPEKLFTEKPSDLEANYQQVILYKEGKVLKTQLLPLQESFEDELLPGQSFLPPTSKDWQKTVGEIEVWQRQVFVEEESFDEAPTLRKKQLFLFLGLFVALSVLPLLKQTEEEKKKPKNSYTKMIYSQEELEQRRKEAAEILKENFEVESVASGSKVEESEWTSESVKTAIQNIKDSPIKATLRSIAKQTAFSVANLDSVKSAGKKAKRKGTGSTKKLSNSKKLKSYKIASLGKIGKKSQRAQGRSGALKTAGIGKAEVKLFEEETIIDGGLDPDVIARVIRQHLGEVRYCYERQLSSNPDLSGKVQLKFAIDAKGQVNAQKIGETSLNNAMVEGCILRRVARWKFPNPKGGTTVRVTYPFVLKTLQ